MKNNLYYIGCLLVMLLATSCEDLEDTYSEYTGDGMIRYIGKCTDLEVQAGWERLRVVYKGNIDAAVNKVKITWQSELDPQPFIRYVEPRDILEGDLMDTVYLENLQDAVYTVKVSNISADSTESIVETMYGRPYTESHEDLRTFTRGIVNFYPINNKLVVVLDGKNENLKEVNLKYWDQNGEEHTWDVIKKMSATVGYGMIRDYMFMLPENENLGIDFSRPLIIERQGLLTGCIDTIDFKPEVLSLEEQVWSAGLSNLMIKNFGSNWKNEVDNIESIELDYNMSTFQDLFYFPKLKKVILGKNRYMLSGHTENLSTTDEYLGLVTLQYLKNTREMFEVECYNKHYLYTDLYGMTYIDLLSEYDNKIESHLLTDRGNENLNQMPYIQPLDTTGWIITCSDTTFNKYKTKGAAWLLVDDENSYFEPGITTGVSVITVHFDMLKNQTVKGFKIVQPGPSTGTALNYLLSSLKIEVSENGYNWEAATYEDGGITIGNAIGETTFIEIPQAKQKPVQYIRLTVANRHVETTTDNIALYSLRLSNFIPF